MGPDIIGRFDQHRKVAKLYQGGNLPQKMANAAVFMVVVGERAVGRQAFGATCVVRVVRMAPYMNVVAMKVNAMGVPLATDATCGGVAIVARRMRMVVRHADPEGHQVERYQKQRQIAAKQRNHNSARGLGSAGALVNWLVRQS